MHNLEQYAFHIDILVKCVGLEANEGANLTHNQNFKLVILSIEKHNITEIIEN